MGLFSFISQTAACRSWTPEVLYPPNKIAGRRNVSKRYDRETATAAWISS
jgi:hypothetical protein